MGGGVDRTSPTIHQPGRAAHVPEYAAEPLAALSGQAGPAPGIPPQPPTYKRHPAHTTRGKCPGGIRAARTQSDQYHHEHLCAPAPERRRGGGGSSRPCVEWGRGEQEASLILVFIWCLSSRMAEAHGGASGRMVGVRTLEKSRFFQQWRGLACVRAISNPVTRTIKNPLGVA